MASGSMAVSATAGVLAALRVRRGELRRAVVRRVLEELPPLVVRAAVLVARRRVVAADFLVGLAARRVRVAAFRVVLVARRRVAAARAPVPLAI